MSWPIPAGAVVFGAKPLYERGLPSTPALNLPWGFATITIAAAPRLWLMAE
jgi:hypothetical protein